MGSWNNHLFYSFYRAAIDIFFFAEYNFYMDEEMRELLRGLEPPSSMIYYEPTTMAPEAVNLILVTEFFNTPAGRSHYTRIAFGMN